MPVPKKGSAMVVNNHVVCLNMRLRHLSFLHLHLRLVHSSALQPRSRIILNFTIDDDGCFEGIDRSGWHSLQFTIVVDIR